MTEIQVGRGMVALVDDEDAERVLRHKWYATDKNRRGGPPLWYATTRDGGVFLHRFVVGAERGQRFDHVNGNGLDCQRANLRQVTQSQNMGNQRTRLGPKTSRYKGVDFWQVSPTRSYWRAQIKAGPIRKTRYCKSENEAALAYNDLAREHFGEFARLNEVGG